MISAGVTPNQIVLSHLIEGLLISLLQFLQYSLYSTFILSSTISLKSALIISMILLLIGQAGMIFGLLCSICFKSVLASFIFGQGIIYPMTFLSGEESRNKLKSSSFFYQP